MLIAQSICSDPILAKMLQIIKSGMSIIQLVVPILLIVSGTIQFIKLMLNPDDDKKGLKKFVNSIAAAVIVFLLPFVINLTMKVINVNGDVGVNENGRLTAFDLSSCWETSKVKDDNNSSNETTTKTIKQEEN